MTQVASKDRAAINHRVKVKIQKSKKKQKKQEKATLELNLTAGVKVAWLKTRYRYQSIIIARRTKEKRGERGVEWHLNKWADKQSINHCSTDTRCTSVFDLASARALTSGGDANRLFYSGKQRGCSTDFIYDGEEIDYGSWITSADWKITTDAGI